ncbi:hypothetical protein BJ170DRAFT_621045 [Xylariales sp. AK1849]|nr:hypothetical protein BJ170DRAFT_621045 [Xylariales sp. AK1849]
MRVRGLSFLSLFTLDNKPHATGACLCSNTQDNPHSTRHLFPRFTIHKLMTVHLPLSMERVKSLASHMARLA